jgi:hypothetical protein
MNLIKQTVDNTTQNLNPINTKACHSYLYKSFPKVRYYLNVVFLRLLFNDAISIEAMWRR